MNTIGLTEAAGDIGKVLEMAADAPVIIERPDKPPAVVLSLALYQQLTATRPPRQFGFGRHLLSGAGINVNELLSQPVDDAFSEYLPDSRQ